MWDKFTPNAREAVARAQKLAEAQGTDTDSGHIVLAALEDEPRNAVVFQLLSINGVPLEEARLYVESTLGSLPKTGKATKLTAGARKVMLRAAGEANRVKSPVVGVEHLFISALRGQFGAHVGQVLRPLGLDAPTLLQQLGGMKSTQSYPEKSPLAHVNPASQKALDAAEVVMRAHFCGQISLAHLLLGLLEEPDDFIVNVLLLTHIDIEELKQAIKETLTSDGHIAAFQRRFSPAVKRALEHAKTSAAQPDYASSGPQSLFTKNSIEPRHLFIALLPGPVSLWDKIGFGGKGDDSLDVVWARFPVELIKTNYQVYREREKFYGSGKTLSGSPHCAQVIESAYQQMLADSQSRISPAHLLAAIAYNPDAATQSLLASVGCDLEALRKSAGDLARSAKPLTAPKREFSPVARLAMQIANLEAVERGAELIESIHLLAGLLLLQGQVSEGETVAACFTAAQAQGILAAWQQTKPVNTKRGR